MDNSLEVHDESFSFWNFNSVINFYKDKHFQIFLLLLVFGIIYVVDHISNINAMIFAMPSAIPGVASKNPGKPSKRSKKSK